METKKCSICGEMVSRKRGAYMFFYERKGKRSQYSDWVCFGCVQKDCRDMTDAEARKEHERPPEPPTEEPKKKKKKGGKK